jgi:simple sugar transport system ATP-binding protein
VLILDEPTSVLTPQEIPQLFSELQRLRDNGKTILFISHHLDEVLALSNRITVMRKGKKIATVNTADTNKKDLAKMMVGRNILFLSKRVPQQPGDPIFSLENLRYIDSTKKIRLDKINLQVRAGEIVGIAGVEGNGQYELVNTIMGLSHPTSGKILVKGDELNEADILERRKFISFVSQDRSKMGAAVKASINENVMMTHHRLNKQFTYWNGRLLDYRYAKQFTRQIEDQFSVNMSSVDSPFKSLSGGNQQKIILGRELLLQTPFLLLDQPTRGLDVGSIEYVHEVILKMRSEKRAILLISADLEELFQISDRIVVINRGKIVADLPVEKTSMEEVGYLMLEGKEKENAEEIH